MSEKTSKKIKKPLLRMLDKAVKDDPVIFAFLGIYTIAAVCVPVFTVALPKVIVGYLTGNAPTAGGIVYISMIFFAAGALVYFLKRFIGDFTYPRITALRIDFIRSLAVKLVSIDYKYMESASFYEEREMAFNSANGNDNGVEGIYHKLFELPQLCLIVLALSVFIGLKSVVILLAIALHIAAASFIAVRVQKFTYSKKELLARGERRVGYYAKTAKDFSYGKDIRLYDLKYRITENLKKEIECYINTYRIIRNREYALGFISLLTLVISDAVIYGTLTYLTVSGMSIADYTMYLAAVFSLNSQTSELSGNITFVMNEYMYVRDLYRFFDEDLGSEDGTAEEKPLAIDDKAPTDIEFDNVTFKYPGADKNVFENFSLKIPAGQKLALVGINGAGKTTFVKLLTGLFKADSGRILINGRNINEYDKKHLYGMFAVVFQDVNILAFTVAQNIACALDGIDGEKVDYVLKQVGLYDKINALEKGKDTMMLKIIEQDGLMLSGGESQKLAIARALYKGGNCVIMDEPTSALDALAEAEIYSEFDALTDGRTAIYISHRLASTKFCDVIALIDGSGLCEYGSHEELMAKRGVYYDMFVTQGKYYQDGGDAA
ncbi:MAG: ABC transporter ATP-binding protein [Eubacteriales bacterium]|nr:ABC transporter ATP-binding protein [Eubacteriales bacterium]